MTDTAIDDDGNGDGTSDDPKKDLAYWKAEIEAYERETQSWYDRGKKVVRRYRDERDSKSLQARSRYNILWSNVQTLQPALYSRDPKPDVSRRFRDADPIGRYAAEVLERCINFQIANQDFGSSIRPAIQDRLLPGRGTNWVRYVPHFICGDSEDGPGGASISANAELKPDDEEAPDTQLVAFEEVAVDHVYWEDFGFTISRSWGEVRAVWKRVYLTRKQLQDRFGDEIADKIELDHEPTFSDKTTSNDLEKKAAVYEIWDSQKREALWIHKNHDEFLDRRDDPLALDGFFPCPRPLFATLTSDSLIPTPDFVQYQDQADEIDDLTQRIAMIEQNIKVVGVYDGAAEGISELMRKENAIVPVKNFAMLGQGGGIEKVISWLPIGQYVDALEALYKIRDQVKQDAYEITGMSDIMRGATDPDETATAQSLKSGYGMLRLRDGQNEVRRYVRDIVRIMGQIIAKHFSIDTIKQISGVQLLTDQEKVQIQTTLAAKQQQLQTAIQVHPDGQGMQPPTDDQVAQLCGFPEDIFDRLQNPSWEEIAAALRDGAHLASHIDIETNSTIMQDEQQDRADRVEFLKAATGFIQTAGEIGAQQPELVPLLGNMLMFGIRGFKVGQELETEFQSAISALEKKAANPQPAHPNPEMMRVQGELEIEKQKAADAQKLQQGKLQADIEDRRAQAAADANASQLEGQRMAQKAQLDGQATQADLAMRERVEMAKIAADRQTRLDVADKDNATKIVVAQITAKQAADASLAAAQTTADSNMAARA